MIAGRRAATRVSIFDDVTGQVYDEEAIGALNERRASS
jgi:hypothetical protein